MRLLFVITLFLFIKTTIKWGLQVAAHYKNNKTVKIIKIFVVIQFLETNLKVKLIGISEIQRGLVNFIFFTKNY